MTQEITREIQTAGSGTLGQTQPMDEASKQMMLAAMTRKSMVLGIVLTCFFGGLGLLYSSITGGIIMIILEAIAGVITFFTFGVGVVLFIPLHLISLIWTIIAIINHNKKIMLLMG